MRYVIASGHWVNVFYGLMRSQVLARTRLFPSYAERRLPFDWRAGLQGQFYEIPEYLVLQKNSP